MISRLVVCAKSLTSFIRLSIDDDDDVAPPVGITAVDVAALVAFVVVVAANVDVNVEVVTGMGVEVVTIVSVGEGVDTSGDDGQLVLVEVLGGVNTDGVEAVVVGAKDALDAELAEDAVLLEEEEEDDDDGSVIFSSSSGGHCNETPVFAFNFPLSSRSYVTSPILPYIIFPLNHST